MFSSFKLLTLSSFLIGTPPNKSVHPFPGKQPPIEQLNRNPHPSVSSQPHPTTNILSLLLKGDTNENSVQHSKYGVIYFRTWLGIHCKAALEIWRNLNLKVPQRYRKLWYTVPKNRFRQHFSFLQNPAKTHEGTTNSILRYLNLGYARKWNFESCEGNQKGVS